MVLPMRVGGICLLSPTMTALVPRPRAPMAWSTVTWDASSKITTSKCTDPGATKVAREAGLTMKQGATVVISRGNSSSRDRKERALRLASSRRRSLATLPVIRPGL